MKILVIGKQARYEKYMPSFDFIKEHEIVYAEMGADVGGILEYASDAEVILADAIAKVPAELILNMPKLRLIHSEGVGYNGIDVNAAGSRGIIVCNNKGINATAVAEQAILLMLGLTRTVIEGDIAEREGRQMDMKLSRMVSGISELGDLTVGLIGFGDIAKETARLLNAFGANVIYYSRTKHSEEEEKQYNTSYVPLDDLLASSDIVSMHVPVTDETMNMANREFFKKMKKTAYIINTARGEVVDNEALREAIISGEIGGAGLDTVAPEPVTKDNILLDLPKNVKYKILFAPHLGGITASTFKRAHANMWNAINALAIGGEIKNRVI